MATYQITTTSISLKDGKPSIGVVNVEATDFHEASKKFWKGDYTTVIDGGGKVVSLAIASTI